MKGANAAGQKRAGQTRGAAPGHTDPGQDSSVARIPDELGEEWPARVYRDRVLTVRTRSYQLPTAQRAGADVEILHTLLGVELKVGRRRLSCPDLATARYLRVFARAGVAEVAVPYDITKISRLADELESGWQRALLLADRRTEGMSPRARSRARSALAGVLRREVEEMGAGTPVPEFNQNTRQRPPRIQTGGGRGGRGEG